MPQTGILSRMILSPQILYWDSDGMYWYCRSSIASEFKPGTLPFDEYDHLDPVREMRIQLARARNRQHNANLFDRWYSIVAHYSCMQLPYASDTFSKPQNPDQIFEPGCSGVHRLAFLFQLENPFDVWNRN
ncbi:hypothetical protein EG328_005510 [Venturia inaequalis]|uniref:Uncharacterized protein n=1 Tax=Venturia inaequalis TaxID=5025 RepID=A0A8H3YS51_VENIN|nr:hypothetical protein EG328_005510 [Venturia inaequalis]